MISRLVYIEQVMQHLTQTSGLRVNYVDSDFVLPILQPNAGCFPIKKNPVFFPILEIFPQSEDFIGIYSQIQKAQAVFHKRQ